MFALVRTLELSSLQHQKLFIEKITQKPSKKHYTISVILAYAQCHQLKKVERTQEEIQWFNLTSSSRMPLIHHQRYTSKGMEKHSMLTYGRYRTCEVKPRSLGPRSESRASEKKLIVLQEKSLIDNIDRCRG